MKYTYINCRDNVYYVRRVTGKRGDRFVCSQKESADDLEVLPDGFELVETPNGQVSCRKILVSLILPEEFELAQQTAVKLAAPALIKCEKKGNEILIYSAPMPNLSNLDLFDCIPKTKLMDVWSKLLQYQAVLKFELIDAEQRDFAVHRMTWRGDCNWMFLGIGKLKAMLNKYAQHIEKDSFYEL
jgi:hypothetical protein